MMSIKEIKALLDEGHSWLDLAMDENKRNMINVTYGRMDDTIVATNGDGGQTAFATTDFRK